MLSRISLPALTLTCLLATSPGTAKAQGSSLEAGGQELGSSAAGQAVTERHDSAPVHVAAALRPSSDDAALLVAPPAADLSARMGSTSVQKDALMDVEDMPLPASEDKHSGAGLGFMIGGAAALVGGLLIGGTAGDVIAIGGVALGVYGVILYF